jgi:hypothetical protein
LSLDQRATDAAFSLRRHLEASPVPDPATIVGRVQHRRVTLATAAAIVVVLAAVVAVGVARVMSQQPSQQTLISPGVPARPSLSLPAGSLSDQGWSLVPKIAAGLGNGTGFESADSTGTVLLLAGSDPKAMIWRSVDGIHWAKADVPSTAGLGAVHAIAANGDTDLAIGSNEQTNSQNSTNFVWRSVDGGATWTPIGDGPNLPGLSAQQDLPYLSGLTWQRGFWITSGNAPDGTGGAWVSTDGVRWTRTLTTSPTRTVTVVEGPGDDLRAYSATTDWATVDPMNWGQPMPMTVPKGLYLESVAPGATLATAGATDPNGPPVDSLLSSDDGGRNWTTDSDFATQFPAAAVSTITRAGGIWVAAGSSGTPNHPDAWISAGTTIWQALPQTLADSVGGTLNVVGAVNGRIVIVGSSPELDHYYVLNVRS